LVASLGIKGLFDNQNSLSNLALSAKQISAIASPDWQKISQIIKNSDLCKVTLLLLMTLDIQPC